MAFAVTQLPGKPIILVKVEVPLENYLSNLRVTGAHLARLVAESQEPLCIWIDLRDRDFSFYDILIADYELNQVSSYPDSIHVAVIGLHPLIQIGIRRLKKHLKMEVDHFNTLEEALSYSFPCSSRPASAGCSLDA